VFEQNPIPTANLCEELVSAARPSVHRKRLLNLRSRHDLQNDALLLASLLVPAPVGIQHLGLELKPKLKQELK
jgi:hypothetical protein